ncbi:hypothetical protein FG386_003559 [Cryptosporidium ryanae]|uniref:uncharacterized protein n=1 Tax=Cryptosporidium ryanae TaxID=515981 RepID=UPI00351AACA5|nr:hypothetical protein FG386_003559 [Cryptosporidium ryanae]
MGDYFPIELDKSKRVFSSEKSSNNRYLYVNSGKEEGIILNLEFSALNGNTILNITSENKFKTINPSLKNIDYLKDEGSFNSKHSILASKLRKDGKLCGIILDSSECIAIDVDTKQIVRRFEKFEEKHTSISFSNDKSKIISGGNTGKLSIFEVSTGELILKVSAHADIIKCILPLDIEFGVLVDNDFSKYNVNDLNYFITCSYDFKINIWRLYSIGKDTNKLNETDNKFQLNVIRTYSHNFPVECIGLTNGTILISCGGSSIKIWNLKNSDLSCVKEISNFGRTITSVSLNDDFFVVGCLDHNLYLYESNSFEFVRSLNFNRGVVKVAISECSTYIVAGLEDGSWVNRKKVQVKNKGIEDQEVAEIKKSYRTGTSRYFKRGREAKVDEVDTEIYINKRPQTKLDKIIRSYSYKKALELTLNMSWSHFISLLGLLSSRGAIHLIAREDDINKVTSILKYVSKNLGKCTPSQFILISEFLEHILYENNLINISNSNQSKSRSTLEIHEYIKKISQKITLEVKQHAILKQLGSAVNIIINSCKRNLT